MWRVGELIRDAFRSLGIPHVLLFVALTAALTWAALASTSAADRAIGQEIQVRSAGADIWIAQAGPNTFLSAVSCMDLAYGSGIVSAGGVYVGGGDGLAAFPGGLPVPVTRVTPGWAAVYVPGIAPGITVGGKLVDELRIEPGGKLFDTSGQAVATVDVVAPKEVPMSLLAAGVTIPAAPPTGLTECAIRMTAGNGEFGRDLLRAAFGADAVVAAFDARDASLDTPWQQWQSATSPPAGVLAGVAIALVVMLMQWFRRSDIAIYRAFGSTVATVVAGGLIEAVLIAVPAVALSIVIMNGMLLAQPVVDLLVLRVGGDSIVIVTAVFVVAYGVATTIVGALNPARLLADR